MGKILKFHNFACFDPKKFTILIFCFSYIILCILADFGKFCLFCTSFARFMDVFVQNFDLKSDFLRIMEKRVCKIKKKSSATNFLKLPQVVVLFGAYSWNISLYLGKLLFCGNLTPKIEILVKNVIFGPFLDREAKKWPIGHFCDMNCAFIFCRQTRDGVTAKISILKYIFGLAAGRPIS